MSTMVYTKIMSVDGDVYFQRIAWWADQRAVQHRTGRENTGVEIGRLGSLLAFWANMKCPWFWDLVLPGVNLWEAFVGQDSEEVHRRVRALPREGRRPRALQPREEPSEWMASVSPPSAEVVGVV
jgi:hypothetical protein